MKTRYRAKTRIWRGNSDSSSDFGKILISPESITISAGFDTLVIAKDQIIELRYVRRRRPRFVVIGEGENEYVYGAFGVFWQKSGMKIYDALRANGYSFTVETEKVTWREAVAEARGDLETYDLYLPWSSTAYYAEVMSARAAKAANKSDAGDA